MPATGAVPQTLRGMPGGFGGQQQQAQQQQNRAVSSRLPNGKQALGNSNSGWAFSGGLPMGNSNNAGFSTQTRQLGGGVSFAQSLSGSQQSGSLDLSQLCDVRSIVIQDLKTKLRSAVHIIMKIDGPSQDRQPVLAYADVVKSGEFPSLSNNAQLGGASQASMWSTAGSRNVSAPVQRNQPTPVSSQHAEELFNSNSRSTATHGSLRFGNPTGQQVTPSSVDDFPPLNRTVNGEERSASLMSSLGLSAQATSPSSGSGNRGNGLLNALSANNRANEPRPQSSVIGAAATPQGSDDENRSQSTDRLNKQLANIGNGGRAPGLSLQDGLVAKSKDGEKHGPVDPLAGMPDADKWGLKGLRTLMNNYPDYHALVVGMDPNSLGLDLQSPEPISTQVYSLFDDNLPKPTVKGSKFRLPDCYNVTNVQPIETKTPSFNEETLFWIFYSCPADIKQQMAAQELHTRNWRWHRKLQIWLTKDEQMAPQILGPNHERGYYIVWDANHWQRERREITLHYSDLETAVNSGAIGA
ncbi:hypothetical protein NQ176_g3250 [Zarea fungicola]|uniref:Uncharacterized protein n=1 Tax=Zarea fungicola TaxID=93591 RepID=A0ACC1NK38_9HYPO|nr:hypothetical protein NQ176_g3250 [Lecanicillium fungicola]